MAIPKFLEDLAIIAKLGEYPGSDNNLTTEQFRAKFDEAGLKIQTYINDTLLPYLNQLVDVQALLDGILDTTLTLADKAANAKAVGDALGRKVSKFGDTMSGILSMNGHRITDVATPTQLTDAVNKAYLRDYVALKYLYAEVTLAADNWSETAPYTQTVELEKVKATDHPHWALILSEDAELREEEKDAYAMVDELDTAEGTVTFTCYEEKPEVDLNIQLEVNRA